MLSARPGSAVSGVGNWALEAIFRILLLTKWRQISWSLDEGTIQHWLCCARRTSSVSLAAKLHDSSLYNVNTPTCHTTETQTINSDSKYLTYKPECCFSVTNPSVCTYDLSFFRLLFVLYSHASTTTCTPTSPESIFMYLSFWFVPFDGVFSHWWSK